MRPVLHVLLPATQLLALTLPLFHYRATIFSILIVSLVIWTHSDLLNTEPTDTDLQSPTNHLSIDIVLAVLSQWPWYLGTLGKILFSTPERDYWRLKRQPGEALTLSWPANFKWAVALYCSPRGVGWNFRVKGVPAYTGPKSRLGFVMNQVAWLAVYALGMDAMGFYTRVYFFGEREWGDEGVTSYSSSWARSAVNALYGLFQPYLGLNLVYGLIAVVCVGLGLDEPENWPPLYGHIQDATTVRRFWNTWWHQCVRKMYTEYGRQLTKALGFSHGSWQSRYTQLYFVFILSATGHATVMYGLPHASVHTTWDRWWSFWLCFACQAVAIQAEDAVIWSWRQLSREGKNDEHKGSKRWQRNVGRLWVVGWCWLVSVWMVDPGLKLGTYGMNPLPVPIVEPLLDFLEVKETVSAIILWDFQKYLY